ncbi:MAG: chorismate mutase [Clostridia bacterium]|nr:chorismate mutase [Clostridia bacterium]
MNLDNLRKEIDKVDSELKNLFLKRMELVHEVYLYKKENNLPVKNEERENLILEERTKDQVWFKDETKEFFKYLIDISCKYQEQKLNPANKVDSSFLHIGEDEFLKGITKVAYQGINGSYGSEMAKILFPDKSYINKTTFYDVCKSIIDKEADCGILPLENLSAGSVSEVYDLIYENDLTIVKSSELKIDHSLLGIGKLEDIKKVKSHPQALCQCSKFITDNGYIKEEGINTALSAFEVSNLKDSSIGAICNKVNAKLYNLNVLKENISDIKDNKTRFIVVTKKKIIVGNPQKISLVFTLPHKVGSLARVLGDFSNNSFNLTNIESRPVKSHNWEYRFYVDIEGSLLNENTLAHLEKISYLFEEIKITGNY